MAMKVHASMRHGLVALLLVMICLYYAEAKVQTTAQQLEIRQHLKRLNKLAIKSIKSPDGDIIDCVHMSHQPAFDHPLLKNHTIQMRPSFHPLGLHDEKKVASKKKTSSIPQLWHQNGRCLEDTIPIRRTKKDDLLRASSIATYGKQMHKTIPNPTSADPNQIIINSREYAVVYVEGDKYYGAKATINVWNPKVQIPKEFSTSQLWIAGDPAGQLNTIEAGWHVYPILYGDNKTRLFTYWHSDSNDINSCWNLNCPGFIQVNKEIALGAVLEPISSYDGPQYQMTILVWKDPKSGNWWLQYGNRSPLGYWPSSLLPNLASSAYLVEWGGAVLIGHQNSEHTSTEMGSGHFPEEDYRKASYFKKIQIVDSSNRLQDPQGIVPFTTRSSCYNVHNDNNDDWGHYFYYGGPGRNPNCP
ncbi:uncharacterized protein LOC120106998 [Phoenix dactylifera]|uniref:Uncharacterized protein LOC120106998 n=1 Tax=Phoenix dactylifera TaxID=42345 RepID=A0A8B8ZPB0_PHODC|nr:uncharacterized protein LOC120106998 [Phoenix dactylifera]